MTDKILENLILHKSARDQWLRNLILEAISSPFELDGPPSQLTRALILIEAINPDLVGESIELIETEYSKGVGEIRNLIETVIAFNKHSKMKNLASAALPWASTNNWHKFSCMFGSKTEIQQAAAELSMTRLLYMQVRMPALRLPLLAETTRYNLPIPQKFRVVQVLLPVNGILTTTERLMLREVQHPIPILPRLRLM